MADSKLTDLVAITQADVDDSTLLYVVDVTGGNISNKVTRPNLFAGTKFCNLTITMPTGPTGSASAFFGGAKILDGTLTFVTNPQSGDYVTNYIGVATLVNPSVGVVLNAATLKIGGPPIASTNVSIANSYSLWVMGGASVFQIPTSGTSTIPSNALTQFVGDGTRTSIYLDDFGAAAPSLQCRRANGSLATPTKTLTNDNIMNLTARGYEQITPGFTNASGQIIVQAVEDFTNTAQGAKMRFLTTPAGTASPVEHFTIGSTGDIAIRPASKLFYDGTSAAGDTFTYEQAANDLLNTVGGVQSIEQKLGATTVTEVNVVIGRLASMATTVADGFLYIPSCAGTPTGTPTSFTGKIPLIYDSTNNKLYAYNAGWKSATFA